MAANKFFIPAVTFIAGLLVWIVFLVLHATNLLLLPTWSRVALSLVAGGLILYSAAGCRMAGGPWAGNAVRAVVLLIMGGSAFWKMGLLASGVLAVAALATGALVLLPSSSGESARDFA